MSPPALPARDSAAEDRWVAALAAEPEEEVAEAARAALRAGRPQLAGRAAGLLDRGAGEDPELERALRAARLLLSTHTPAAALQELDAALAALQGAWMQRFKARQRRALREPAELPRRRPRGR